MTDEDGQKGRVEKVSPDDSASRDRRRLEIITNVVDYNLSTLYDLIQRRTINLSPSYQRRHRWGNERKSKLIESFLMNVPVPPIFLNEDSYGEYSVIDGQQRLTAIVDFFDNELILEKLEVFPELNGKRFADIPRDMQYTLRTRTVLRAVIVLRHSDAEIKLEVFERLNTGGISLNAQEVRNATFSGPLNDLILELSALSNFQILLGAEVGKKSRIHTEMKDAELVLRYLAFKDHWKEFSGGVASHLSLYMEENRYLSYEKIDIERKDFIESLLKVELLFSSEGAFRRWIPEKNHWRSTILASLFDAEMIAVREFTYQYLTEYRNEILSEIKKLFDEDDFQKWINAAVPSYFKLRIQRMIQAIASAAGINESSSN